LEENDGVSALSPLRDLVAAELSEPVDPRVSAMAAAVAAAHGKASRAVLFYGSCLREKQLEGLMLDFYLIVSDYRAAYDRRWLATANRLIPPNVFPFAHDGLSAKYAVLSEADFARLCSVEAGSVSVWARFAQPSRLVWAADEAAREHSIAAVAQAAPTLFALTPGDRADPLATFREGFRLTYGAELRAERKTKGGSIVDSDPERYRRFGEAVLAAPPPARSDSWAWRQRKGKALSVVRIAKASFTFAGGIDYLAWKISRHSGVPIAIKPWQRRWPLVAAFTLLPRLMKRGAIR
jgi:hypothetical protein